MNYAIWHFCIRDSFDYIQKEIEMPLMPLGKGTSVQLVQHTTLSFTDDAKTSKPRRHQQNKNIFVLATKYVVFKVTQE